MKLFPPWFRFRSRRSYRRWLAPKRHKSPVRPHADHLLEPLESRLLLSAATFELSDLLPANGGDDRAGFVVKGVTGADFGSAVSTAGDVNGGDARFNTARLLRALQSSGPMITEFMAINDSTLADEDGDLSDWIEVHNASATLIDLEGFSLTDDADQLDKWKFPSVELAPGGFLTVFASGKDRAIAGSELHTNFQLRSTGEYLALVEPDGTIASEYTPEFPLQRSDISFGVAGASSPLAGQMVYFAQPTPGEENISGIQGFVAFPSFDIEHGLYNEPFDVSMMTDTPNATIRYTLDGSLPTPENGLEYFAPIQIATTTTLRATAFKDNYLPSDTLTQTYISPDDVIRQPTLPTGFPADWGTHRHWYNRNEIIATVPDYEMDQAIVDDPRYSDEMSEALTALPTVSLVMNVDDLFGTDGIYSKPGRRQSFLFNAAIDFSDDLDAGSVSDVLRNRFDQNGMTLTAHATASFEEQGKRWRITDLGETYTVTIEGSKLAVYSSSEWARSTSIEFIDADGGFQVDAGVRIHGGWSRSPFWTSKHSFRVLFKSEFGPSKLEYPFFGASATDRFDQLILRAGFQDTWTATVQRGIKPILLRDEMMRRSRLAMGQPDPHGRFIHLYLNGLYWGIYNVSERPNDSFGAAYFGGDKSAYDALNQGVVSNGNDAAWRKMFDLVNGEASISLLQLPFTLSDDPRVGATVRSPARQYGFNSNAVIIFDYHSPSDFKFAGAFLAAGRWRMGHVEGDTWIFDTAIGGAEPGRGYDIDITFQDTNAILSVDGVVTLSHDYEESLTDGEFGLGSHFAVARFDDVHVGDAAIDDAPPSYIEDFNDGVADHLQAVSGEWQVNDGSYSVTPDIASPERYEAIQQYLDVPNLVDYMLVHYYYGTGEWPSKGFWALRERKVGTGFKFVSWDVEVSMGRTTDDRTRENPGESPARLLHRLRGNPEFRIYFADQVQRHLFNDGALSSQSSRARLVPLVDELNTAILTESARWGRDNKNRDDDWQPEIDRLLDSYLVNRHDIVLEQLREADLFPSFDATTFNQHGGAVADGFELRITNPNRSGIIYYTIDGGDPREPGDGVSANALAYLGPITLSDDVTIKSRIHDGSTWSAINAADFVVGHVTASTDNPVVTELNYHPHAADPALGELDEDANEFAFIELLNLGSTTIDLTDLHFTDGIAFNFNAGVVTSLAPGERVLVVENQAAFESRYGTGLRVAGQYSGRLSNGGETIRLEDAENTVIVEFTYDNVGDWPQGADGRGSSLEVIDPQGDHNDPANWRSSTEHGGSPGTAGIGPTVVVGRHIFYNRSSFDGNDASANANDDNAIAPDKMALLSGQTASFQNYTSYSRGINGIMVDIANLADASGVSADDFEFRVGNNDDPSTWSTVVTAPLEVLVRPGAGIDGSNRVTIVWGDHVIEKQWLQVTVLPTSNTGLSAPDVRYWGNAVGDSGDNATNAHVTAADELTARFNPHTFIDPALIDDVADYNRDRFVNTTDELTSRFNATSLVTALQLITALATGAIRSVHLQRPLSSNSQALALLTRSMLTPEQDLGIIPPAWFGTRPSEFVLDKLLEDDRVDLLALQFIDKTRIDDPFQTKRDYTNLHDWG